MLTVTSAKHDLLRRYGSLYRHPDRVTDPLFQTHEFFDAHDLVQVKYEMLRQVRVEHRPIAVAAAAFGLSRPAYYQAQATYARWSLPGLIRQRPGPRRSHKLTDQVRSFLAERGNGAASLGSTVLATRVKEHFQLIVHPRTIERLLTRRPKKVWKP